MSKKGARLPEEIQAHLRRMGLDHLRVSKLEKELNGFLTLMNSRESDEQVIGNMQQYLNRMDENLKSMNVDRQTLSIIQQIRALLQNTNQATLIELLRNMKQLDLQNIQGRDLESISRLLK